MKFRDLIFPTDWRPPDAVHPHQRFLEFCRWQVSGNQELGTVGSDSPNVPLGTLDPAPLTESNLVCSDRGTDDLHMPILDLDMDAMLIPSSTPGHHHLCIGKPMTWENYEKLLDVLAEVGILESGYVAVSKKRKRTQVRTPWTRK